MVALRQIFLAVVLICCAAAPAAATVMMGADEAQPSKVGIEATSDGFVQDSDAADLRAGSTDAGTTDDHLRHKMSQLPDAATWVLLVGGFSLIGLSLRGSHTSGARRAEPFGVK